MQYLALAAAFYLGMVAAFSLRYLGRSRDPSAHPGYTCQEMWRLHLKATSTNQRKLRPAPLPEDD